MDFCCKHKQTIENNGEYTHCNTSNTFGDDAHQTSKSENDSVVNVNSKDRTVTCPCGQCRTKWLTTKLTLHCHYCETGFLLCTDDQRKSFECVDCGKCFESLPFIVRLCGEIEDEFRYWKNDFYTKPDQPQYAVDNMAKFYQELAKCIHANNIKMIELAVDLAEVYNIKQCIDQAIVFNHTAIRSLLGYQFDSVADKIGLIEQIVKRIETVRQAHQEQMTTSTDCSYMADTAQLMQVFAEFQTGTATGGTAAVTSSPAQQ